MLPVRFWFSSAFGLKISGFLPEVSGNRKFLKLQFICFQRVIYFSRNLPGFGGILGLAERALKARNHRVGARRFHRKNDFDGGNRAIGIRS